ncbi:unnamed protein product [Timema podura]|uniref:Uncharacterized protein n=1 Tax=Timema podura TaxID=61482 RepID=A0ABN7PBZ3_TIMPD|nr:unnamed protein product [Timema podura]
MGPQRSTMPNNFSSRLRTHLQPCCQVINPGPRGTSTQQLVTDECGRQQPLGLSSFLVGARVTLKILEV